MSFNFEERYAPKSISDIVFANNTIRQLVTDIVDGHRQFPMSGKNGILLYGVNGTGKSALANLLPDAIEAFKCGSFACATIERIEHGNDGAALMQRIKTEAVLVPVASHRHFVLDEVDLLKGPIMGQLKSVMNIPQTIFVMTTNHYIDIEIGVRDRCHCIPFNAAPSVNWLPLAKRMLADADIHTITDEALISVIDTCNGSARNIVDAIVGVILTRRKNAVSKSQTDMPASVVKHDTTTK